MKFHKPKRRANNKEINMRNKIGLDDTLLSTIVKLAEGNPGAATVCSLIAKDGDAIDPDAAFGGGLMSLLQFDTLGLYGPRIWMLYKDVCGQDLVNTLGILRGHQLGFITEGTLNHAIDNYGDGLDVESVLEQVKERLPNFGQNGEEDV